MSVEVVDEAPFLGVSNRWHQQAHESRTSVKLAKTLTLGCAWMIGCSFNTMQPVSIDASASSPTAHTTPSDPISSDIETILKCWSPDADQSSDCQNPQQSSVDWKDTDSAQKFVNDLAVKLVTLSASDDSKAHKEYKRHIERLATQGLKTNQPAALGLLIAAQQIWEVNFREDLIACGVLYPQGIYDTKQTGVMFASMPMAALLARANPRGVAFALWTAAVTFSSIYIGPKMMGDIKDIPRYGAGLSETFPTQLPRQCQQLPVAPAQVIYFGPEARKGDAFWNAEFNFLTDRMKLQNDTWWYSMAIATPMEVMLTASKVPEQVVKHVMSAFQWMRRGASVVTGAVTVVAPLIYITALFEVVEAGVSYGLDKWHESDLLEALSQAKAPTLNRQDPASLDSARALSQVRDLSAKTMKVAYFYNQASTQKWEELETFILKHARCEDGKKPLPVHVNVLQLGLANYRASLGGGITGGRKGQQCLIAFEKNLLLGELMGQDVKDDDLRFYQPESRNWVQSVRGIQNPADRRAQLQKLRQTLEAELARQFEKGEYCPHMPGLLLQLKSYLKPYPVSIRANYELHIEGLLYGFEERYKLKASDIEGFECPSDQ